MIVNNQFEATFKEINVFETTLIVNKANIPLSLSFTCKFIDILDQLNLQLSTSLAPNIIQLGAFPEPYLRQVFCAEKAAYWHQHSRHVAWLTF